MSEKRRDPVRRWAAIGGAAIVLAAAAIVLLPAVLVDRDPLASLAPLDAVDAAPVSLGGAHMDIDEDSLVAIASVDGIAYWGAYDQDGQVCFIIHDPTNLVTSSTCIEPRWLRERGGFIASQGPDGVPHQLTVVPEAVDLDPTRIRDAGLVQVSDRVLIGTTSHLSDEERILGTIRGRDYSLTAP